MSGQGGLGQLLGSQGKPRETKALSDKGRSVCAGRRGRLLRGAGGRREGRREGRGTREGPFLLAIVNKVAAHPIRAEADGMERAARLRFVFWVSVQIAQLFSSVRKLTLPPILAETAFGKRSTQLGLVA